MTLADSKLARHPQTLWWRRALFQVHLWTGLGFGLYILVVSLSGSAIVFRHELAYELCPRIVMVQPSGPRLSNAQLAAAARLAQRSFSRGNVRIELHGPRVPGAAVEAWYFVRQGRVERLLDPYTGKDLGDAVACEPTFVSRLADLHDELLAGSTGLAINGIGGALLLLMCLTGAVLWWPGTARFWRSMTLRRNVHWRRFVWDLHSVLGFWMFALILMWAVSGVYLAFPNSFYDVGDFLIAHGAAPATSHKIDVLINWLVTLHFGRAFGPWIKVLWTILGLVPAALIATGALMWWNRVMRRTIGRSGEAIEAPSSPPAVSLDQATASEPFAAGSLPDGSR